MVRAASPWRLGLCGALSALASLLGPVVPSGAQTATLRFVAEADARVEKSNPKRNFGASSRLTVDKSPVKESYLRFTVAGAAGPVQEARLRLWAASGSRTARRCTSRPTPGPRGA
jgi:hypothetical protein